MVTVTAKRPNQLTYKNKAGLNWERSVSGKIIHNGRGFASVCFILFYFLAIITAGLTHYFMYFIYCPYSTAHASGSMDSVGHVQCMFGRFILIG